MGAEAAGMNDALGDSLMIEVEDLFAEVKVFERRGATRTDPERVLVVRDGNALLGGQNWCPAPGGLVHFSTRANRYLLVGVLRRDAVAHCVFRRSLVGLFVCHILSCS